MKNDNKKYKGVRTFVLSLIFAIAIWVVVGVVTDPDIRHTIKSLPIHYIGTDELADKGLVILAPTDRVGAAVKISGKRRDLIKYSDEAYLSVDVSGISRPGEYSLRGTSQLLNNRISIVSEHIGEVDVVAEVLEEKEIPVETKLTGVPKGTLIKAMAQNEKITVKGAQSEIAQLSKAVITIDASDITDATTAYENFRLCDESDAVLTKAHTLNTDTEMIAVDLTVYEKKTLPIKLKLSEELSSKYYLDTEKSSLSRQSVDVGVLSDCEAECVYAQINSSAGESAEFNLIEEEGMYIPSEISKVTAKPHISALISQYRDLPVRVQNISEGRTAAFEETLTDVLLIGPEELLGSSDIHLIIDLEGLGTGNHRVDAKISDERIQVDEKITIDVEIGG